MRFTVALGGNALSKGVEALSVETQRAAIRENAKSLVNLLEADHGNPPIYNGAQL